MPVLGAPSNALSNLEHTVTETPFTTAPLAIEDHHVDAQPLRETAVGGDVAVKL